MQIKMLKKVANRQILECNFIKLNYEQQRFRRYLPQPKPLWKPVSVQKLFNVPVTKKMLESDEAQLEKDESEYLNKFRSIKEYLNREFTIPALQGGSNIELKEVREEHERLLNENNRENARVAKLREERLKKEQELEELEDLKLKLIENERYQVEKEKAIKKIQKEKERYEHYITKDKLKDAIETAIDHPTTYDYAIDLNGVVVFDDRLHPSALQPSADPDTADVIGGFKDKSTIVKLKQKTLYYD